MRRDILIAHYLKTWPDHDMDLFSWELGPIRKVLPDFRVCRISPLQPPEPWVYVSIGASIDDTIEFFILSPEENPRHVESLAIVAHFHATGGRLTVGRIVNCGRPWLEGSKCDHFFVSLPYPYGPALEWCDATKQRTQVLWLLPITSDEADFAALHGIEALESAFDKAEIEMVDPQRPSVVNS